ncbi:c-type cytochrome biogenesis protein CcmI [Cochlodiniinecator piscidefendens]|uniref:c-type cytochrome biogenesis protein CcmI n=1 Tax=Cochlodiniinecator piscidefendens TaxID=2715756 RepID=UPI00140C2DC0|nr:c-type cytochrome biogenesis protein CcmI [Cochlodiniinecator piscidefendens]
MLFWITSAALAVFVTMLLSVALVKARNETKKPQNTELDFYRIQYKDLERDIARGVIDASEGERAKLEISRRILDADKNAHAASVDGGQKGISLLPVALMIGFLIFGTGGLYFKLGTPGAHDQPISSRLAAAQEAMRNRPGQAEAEADVPAQNIQRDRSYIELIDQLRNALAERPDDLQGHLLLVGNEAQLGNFIGAYTAQQQVIHIKGTSATSDDYADLADLMILAAGGYISPEAERALVRSLQLNERNGTARYFSGLLFAQTGRPDRAFEVWRGQLAEGPETAPWIPAIRAQIDQAAYFAGVQYEQPAPIFVETGPDAAAIAAAENLSPQERAEMIRGMVEGLSARLAQEGGPVEDWARLVVSLTALNETERARAILAEAQRDFASDPTALEHLNTAATQAGLTQ